MEKHGRLKSSARYNAEIGLINNVYFVTDNSDESKSKLTIKLPY